MEDMTPDKMKERLIQAYKHSYDLTAPYKFGGLSFDLYGYFYAHQEKYVLTREAQMWEKNGYDHLFVTMVDKIDVEFLSVLDRMIRDHAEPELVRAGRKHPAKNHMYSDITVVVISSSAISDNVRAWIRRYRFARNYLFTIRGWCDARLIAIDLAENSVYGNAKAKPLLSYYQKMLNTGMKEE